MCKDQLRPPTLFCGRFNGAEEVWSQVEEVYVWSIAVRPLATWSQRCSAALCSVVTATLSTQQVVGAACATRPPVQAIGQCAVATVTLAPIVAH